ncbi:MAG: DnaJ domain-containing protein [Deltaproteobacteria bacterium]|jgi:DnaJ-class molecular chaperone|nr:DnaJ domain-containing protein [Deltaproteobacteria bacterium]
MVNNAYKELNIREGAGEIEIKAAFRRLAKLHHPDLGTKSSADIEKFRRATAAYKDLLKKLASQPKPEITLDHSVKYVFLSRSNAGLDVYYELALVRPQDFAEFKISLPRTAFDPCPRCLGQGQTLARFSHTSSLYRPQSCPKCGGSGAIERKETLSITVTPEMAQRGRFRLRGAGKYLPSQAKRGDLIVTIRFTTSLPKGH